MDNIYPTFTHEEPLQYSLTCTLNNKQAHNDCLDLSLQVPTDTFPRAYMKTIDQNELSIELKLIFESVVNLYRTLKDKQNLVVLYNWGIVRVKYWVTLGGEKKQKWLEIKMDRSTERELDEIRKTLAAEFDRMGNLSDLDNRIDKIWKRKQQNEKIFLKFREDIEFKVDEIGERISIQNTKLAILREDVNRLLHAFDKLSAIVCPIFSKINSNSAFTTQFILQDRKIMYIGETGLWTQILLRNELLPHRKIEICFKVVNSKRSNIVAGITLVSQLHLRSSLQSAKNEKWDRKYIGLSGMGHLYTHEFSASELKNVLVPQHHESEKQRENSREKEQKSNNEMTMSSPMGSSIKTITGSKGNHSNEVFKPMQIIKMSIELDKERIGWRNGSRVLLESKIGADFKNEPAVPYFQFCDTGDSIEFMDL